MIRGYVNEALEPVIELGIRHGTRTTLVEAVVDTGFSGSLCLSEQHLDDLEMIYAYAESYELADGQVVSKDVFQGVIVFEGSAHTVELILTASADTLVGASLLKAYRLTIDYPERSVRLERDA